MSTNSKHSPIWIYKPIAFAALFVSMNSAFATCTTITGNTVVSSALTSGLCSNSSSLYDITVNSPITVQSNEVAAIYQLSGTLGTITNNSTLDGANSTTNNPIGGGSGLTLYGTVNTINNNANGVVHGKATGPALSIVGGNVTTINNAGAINGGTEGLFVENSGQLGTLNNTGTISATAIGGGNAIYLNSGSITTIINSGSLTGTDNGILTSTGTPIGTITNTGTITGGSSGFGINNYSSTITTLNNQQTGLTYTGTLPTNYNIIIYSTTRYGQLFVTNGTGTTTFGVSSLSSGGNGLLGNYSTVLKGISSTQLGFGGATTYSGTSNGYSYTLNERVTTAGSEEWDIVLTTAAAPAGPTAADTQASLTQSASALRPVFNQQSALINNSLNYDCTVFAANGACVSAGGRFATTNSITGEQMSTLLVASYKTTKNTRIGGFIDQNGSSSSFNGVSLDKSPMYGVFGVWNENPDLMGYEVRLATNWADQNITQTRNVVGTSEAGTGSASLKSQAISGVVSYAMPVTDSTWIASPYVGVRKTKITRGGYTESSAVTTPLTYSDLSQDITTALAGVRMNKKYRDDLYATASVGVEQNIGSNISTLDATGVTGLTSTDFSANYAKTRPVASAGLSYAVAKDQRINFSVHYRKEAFQSAGSTTGLLMYQVGL